MAAWIVVLVVAVAAAVVGFGTAATWLVVVAVVLLAIGAIGLLRSQPAVVDRRAFPGGLVQRTPHAVQLKEGTP